MSGRTGAAFSRVSMEVTPGSRQGEPTISWVILAIDPVTPTILYAGSETNCCWGDGMDRAGGGVFKSTDGGGTWLATQLTNAEFVGAFWHVDALAVDPRMPDTVYAVRIYEFYKSTDGGMTWRTIPLAAEGR